MEGEDTESESPMEGRRELRVADKLGDGVLVARERSCWAAVDVGLVIVNQQSGDTSRKPHLSALQKNRIDELVEIGSRTLPTFETFFVVANRGRSFIRRDGRACSFRQFLVLASTVLKAKHQLRHTERKRNAVLPSQRKRVAHTRDAVRGKQAVQGRTGRTKAPYLAPKDSNNSFIPSGFLERLLDHGAVLKVRRQSNPGSMCLDIGFFGQDCFPFSPAHGH